MRWVMVEHATPGRYVGGGIHAVGLGLGDTCGMYGAFPREMWRIGVAVRLVTTRGREIRGRDALGRSQEGFHAILHQILVLGRSWGFSLSEIHARTVGYRAG